VIVAYEFAPGRLVLASGERVRADPDEALGVLLGDFDVLGRLESEDAALAILGLARGHILSRLDRAQSDYDHMAAKKRSGKPWTEEQYKAAGIQLLHIRLKPENHEPLDELAAQWGLTRGEAVKRAIDEAHARHVAPYVRRGELEQPDDESHVRPQGGQKSDNKNEKAT
jgi:hypothetical protein